MNRTVIIIFSLLLLGSIAGHLIWNYVKYQDYLSEIIHETERWAVMEDSHGQHLAVETTNSEIWDQLVKLFENKEEKWIGGIVEEFYTKWGFRFTPDTIMIADYTVEGGQSTIKGISEEMDYWMNTWANIVYVWAKVIEIHE